MGRIQKIFTTPTTNITYHQTSKLKRIATWFIILLLLLVLVPIFMFSNNASAQNSFLAIINNLDNQYQPE